MRARPSVVAGTFYPEDPKELRQTVESLLAKVSERGPAPKAIVAPHAGYVYSGPIAATVFARLRDARDSIRRVVLLGPAHRVSVRGIGTSSADAFETPLGEISLDRDLITQLEGLPCVSVADRAHAPEHCLEVELPFLQVVLASFSLVPLVVGDATIAEIESVLEMCWGGAETLVVVSSDLSHYYEYATARRMDEATANAVVDLAPENIGEEDACGRVPLRGLLSFAKRRGMSAERLDLRSSGDTAGSKREVVGYGAFALR
jgi:AmmeMemoRadiSam system protein B